MDNNEENLNSQEQTTSTTSTSSDTTKTTNFKQLAIIAVAILAVILLFLAIFTRSPKSTVDSYIKSMFNAKASKAYSLMDEDGAAAFAQLSYTTEDGKKVYNFENFEELLEKVKDAKKDLDSDEKKQLKEDRKELIDSLQETLDDVKSEIKDNKIKWKIKDIKTYSVKDCKKVTKVTAKLQITNEDGDKETQSLTFYTLKKGLKNYVIGGDSLF